MTFRVANCSDWSLVAKLNQELLQDENFAVALSEDQLLDRLAKWISEGHQIILFEVNSEPIGYALFSFGERLGEKLVYLRHFFIRPQNRRQGYGRMGFEHLAREVFPGGAPVYVDTRYENLTAREFWKSLHFDVFSLTLMRPGLKD